MELKNYQKRIVEFCKTTDKVILSVGMGLGKTAAVMVVMVRRLGYLGLRKGNENKTRHEIATEKLSKENSRIL